MSLLKGPFAPRPSSPRTAAQNVRRTALQIVFFWGFFLGLLPIALLWLERQTALREYRFASDTVLVVGFVIFLLASALGLWSGFTMAKHGEGTPLPATCARKLVVEGPYRYIRNPMAVAGLAQGFTVGLMMGSPLVVAYSLGGVVVWNWLVRPIEERDLVERFGEPYERYRRAVRCWVPRLDPYGQ